MTEPMEQQRTAIGADRRLVELGLKAKTR